MGCWPVSSCKTHYQLFDACPMCLNPWYILNLSTYSASDSQVTPKGLTDTRSSGARKGVLESRYTAGENPRRSPHCISYNGSGEPARAWSPAWDTISGGSLQWLPARVMSDLPGWHTQRCGRCQNSRYPHGQTRTLPLSSTKCSARTSPSTILRHRPPVTRS